MEKSLSPFSWPLTQVCSTLGFVFALNHLCDGAYSVSRISEWSANGTNFQLDRWAQFILCRLIFIWFGLDGSGLDKSPKFHPYLGPVIFTVYAALTNTLLVSLLVAILSTTYSAIATDAVESARYGVRAGDLTHSNFTGRRGHVSKSCDDL